MGSGCCKIRRSNLASLEGLCYIRVYLVVLHGQLHSDAEFGLGFYLLI
jgi:hypothetical protein